MKTITVLTMTIACFTLVIQAQEVTDRQSAERHGSIAGAYSQAEHFTHYLPLDLLALNDPGALAGLAVLDTSGQELGTVAEITRSRSDQSLYAMINLASGAHTALSLDELTLEALAYYDPAQSLSDQLYEPEAFEQISQYQAGHSARGSLSNPVEGATSAERDDQSADPLESAQQTVIEQQTQADSAQLETTTQTPGNGGAAGSSYNTSGSPLVQLALTNPDALQGKQLLDETSNPLGEISHIAKNIANQALYAVINMNGQHAQAAVKLDALGIGKLAYTGALTNLERLDFADEDFVPIAGQ